MGRRRRLRHQGVPVPRHGPSRPRGRHAPRRGVRRRAPRRPVSRYPAGTTDPAWQQQSRRGAGDSHGTRRRPDRHRFVRRDRPPRRPAGIRSHRAGQAQGPGARHPRCRSTHARVRAYGPGGFKVRFLRLLGRRGRGGCGTRAHARRRAGRGARTHRQSGLRGVFLRTGGRGARGVLRSARAARVGRRRRAGRPLRQRRVGPDPGRLGRGDAERLRPRGRRPRRSDLGGAGALHSRHRRHHPLHGRDRQASPGYPHVCERRWRHERQSAPRPLWERL